jgi:hypothetical protein
LNQRLRLHLQQIKMPVAATTTASRCIKEPTTTAITAAFPRIHPRPTLTLAPRPTFATTFFSVAAIIRERTRKIDDMICDNEQHRNGLFSRHDRPQESS